MKRFLSVLISLFLVMSLSVSVAYAKDNGHKKAVGQKKIELSQNDLDSLMNSLKEQMKQYHRDTVKRNDILKKLKDLRLQLLKLQKAENKLAKDASDSIIAFVNGRELTTEVPPVIKYGRTLVPLRALVNALGAQVQYDPATHVITITKNGTVIVLKQGSDIAIVNGKEVKIEVPSETVSNRVIVPIRFIAEIFDQKVEWDSNTGSIIIEDKEDEDKDDDNGTGTNPAPAAISVNDSTTGSGSSQFDYEGTWNYGYQPGAYNNDIHQSVSADAYCQISFTGTQIKLYGAKDPGAGIATASLDNVLGTDVDYYAANRSDKVLLYTSPVLPEGQHTLKVSVTGRKNNSSSNYYINIDKVDIISNTATNASPDTNLALNKTAVASSSYDSTMTADKAMDGNAETRWSSQFSDPQWIYTDLGSVQNVGKVKLSWEAAYAKSYRIQVSSDAANWSDVYSTTSGDGESDNIAFTPVNARYVRVYCTERGSNYGYSLWEFGVYSK